MKINAPCLMHTNNQAITKPKIILCKISNITFFLFSLYIIVAQQDTDLKYAIFANGHPVLDMKASEL